MSNAIVLLIASLLGALHGTSSAPDGTSPLLGVPVEEAQVEEDRTREVPTWPITFYFENRRESLSVSLFDFGAFVSVSRDALAALSHHVRCFRTDRERPLHPRLAEIVARVSEAFGRDTVDVVSGYRAPPYGAPHSKHFQGRAMDFRLPNVKAKKIAAWVWKNFRGVGVGYYPKQNFVHVDVRDLDVRWIDTSLHGESAHARYFARTPSETPLPDHAPMLAYDRPNTPPLSTPSAIEVLSLSMPAAPGTGIRGAD